MHKYMIQYVSNFSFLIFKIVSERTNLMPSIKTRQGRLGPEDKKSRDEMKISGSCPKIT